MADIFVSYASKDRPWVQSFATCLQDQGWTVWWDRKIPVGQSYHDVLEREIDAARCVIVVWTVDSVSSDWVRTEAEEGKRRRVLVPVSVGEPRIPLGFRSLQAAQLSARVPSEPSDEFAALLESVRQIAPLGSGTAAAVAATEGAVIPTWRQVFWTEYLAALRLDDINQPQPPRAPRGTNSYFPMPPSGSVNWVSAYIASSKHEVGVYLVLSAGYAVNKEVFSALQSQHEGIEREIGSVLHWDTSAKSFLITVRKGYTSIDAPPERRELLHFLTDTTNRFVNAFRPRIAGLLRELGSDRAD